MKNRITLIGIFIFCVIISAGLTTQAKNANSEHAFVSAKVLEDNEVSKQAEQNEIDSLKKLIKESEKTIEKYESEHVSNLEIMDEVDKNYEEMKMAAGFTEVSGQGITIFLDDGVRELREGENANDIIVHDLDLMMIIDELIKAGAEAISVNGERYMATTEVSCSGHTVKINGRTYARPFYINAIGDQSTLYSAMTIRGGYANILSEYGLIFKIEKADSVTIPAYKGSLTMDYMILEEEGD